MTEDISPNVSILESNSIINTNIYPTQNIAMYIGEFEKGAIDEPVLISSPLQFKQTFGRSLDFNYNHWYQVYNYLLYPGSPKIWVCRTSGSDSTSASNNGNIASSPGEWGNLLVVEIYDKTDYNDISIETQKYLKQVFNVYSINEINKKYLIIIKRSNIIVETSNIDFNSDLESSYLSEINLIPGIYELSGGFSSPAFPEDYQRSFELFTKEDYEIDIVIAHEEINDVVIDFVETRKDCVAFLNIPRRFVKYLLVNDSILTSEQKQLIVIDDYKLKNKLDEQDYNNIKNYLSELKKSSYAFMTLGFKKQLDKFTGKSRLIATCGDIAGLKAQASSINPWSIGAGLERGRLKEYEDLSMRVPQNKYQELYKLGVNSVQNGVLMSQKMFIDETFNVSRMHQRNIYNYLERKCEKLLRKYLFELNDLRLRGIIASEIKMILMDMVDSRGIEAGKVQVSKNSENNIIINIYIKMINIAEIVRLGIANVGTNSVDIASEIRIKGL